jgi:hypothetical protein
MFKTPAENDLTAAINAVVARFTVDGKLQNDDTIMHEIARLKKGRKP